jgi:hypothetical protein
MKRFCGEEQVEVECFLLPVSVGGTLDVETDSPEGLGSGGLP